ncbi:SDR family oxidoreductase [Humibacillus xanthopallidus]|uniref:Short-subunit dehydrogenase n=1 Tax=Humibacillus xanthopallidus TaxID=412689 RepID=A0A543I1R7_9MICO|nr:SDR family oxidoreductase [Humibacillus xanthopallidus]TQM64410.1 short-subunit dehydrogenase [Humibacillus xanthopallidus]
MSTQQTRPVAVVTGGTRGIGLGIVRDLAPTHHVVVGGRSADTVGRLVAELPSAQGLVADLGDCAPGGSLERALEDLVPTVPRVDVLVHSAGILRHGSLAEATVSDWAESMTVNVVAVAAVTRALLPALRAAHGLVIAVNSGSGFTSGAQSGAYSASKFALRALTDALREEERGNGVRVTSLHPGRVDTDMQHELVGHEGADYDATAYLDVDSVVAAARLAIEAGPRASVDLVSVRPRGWRPDAD